MLVEILADGTSEGERVSEFVGGMREAELRVAGRSRPGEPYAQTAPRQPLPLTLADPL